MERDDVNKRTCQLLSGSGTQTNELIEMIQSLNKCTHVRLIEKPDLKTHGCIDMPKL